MKTIGPRGTVHLLAAADLPAWNAVLDAALEPPGFAPGVRLDADQTDEVIAAIDGALADAELTLDELDAEVVRRAGAWAGERVMPAFQELWPRWRQAIRPGGGPRRALLRAESREPRHLHEPAALAARLPRRCRSRTAGRFVLRRYLHAYGPGRARSMSRAGSAAPPAWATELFTRRGGRLEQVDVEGEELWQLAGDEAPAAAEPGTIRLLPYFDAYAVGCHPRERVFPGRAGERALARTPGRELAGAAGRRGRGRRLAPAPLGPEARAHGRAVPGPHATRARELDDQVERLAAIQEATATMTIGTVTVGPHA